MILRNIKYSCSGVENEQTLYFWFYFLDLENDIVLLPIHSFADNQAENR